MTSAPFDFKAQLRVGRAGEALLLKHWPHAIRRHTELRGPDFVDSTGAVIELKTDTYDYDRTPNIFVERHSDHSKGTPGGPWQAVLKGSTTFVYLFIKNRRWLVFTDIPALCVRVEGLIVGGLVPVQVMNRGYVTLGYKVPREALAGLYIEEELK